MKRISSIMFSLFFAVTFLVIPPKLAQAAGPTPITRAQVEQRALSMTNLTWTYSKDKNSNIDAKYAPYVTQPRQFADVTTSQFTGIPYNWGGFDGIDTNSFNVPWTSFIDAVNKGAYTGNVNSHAGLGYITGTAGLDCSGFVQAAFNIKDYKQSTTTLLNNYFSVINLSDIKHMDILDKPGDHTVIFDRWGTLNGIEGAFTYESTPDQTYGGIQGAKQYFITMKQINSGYIPARYVNIIEDSTVPVPVPDPAPAPAPVPVAPASPHPVDAGVYAQVANVTSYANLRANPSTSAAILGTIPKDTILYMIDYSSGWYKVSYNNKIGWISGSLIGSIPSGKYVTINNVYQLNMRNNPSSTSQIVGTLSVNQYAKVIGSYGNWYQISINGIQGWVYNKYVKYINS